MSRIPPLIITLFSILLTACNSGVDETSSTPTNTEHVWKEQTKMLESAREVEKTVLDAAELRRKAIDKQGE